MTTGDPTDRGFGHSHDFLGAAHARSERNVWAVIALTSFMMVAEIVGGAMFGSIALIADGFHMSTHAGALLLAALAYTYARRRADDPRFTFGTGKFGDLAGFTSAIVLAMIAALIAYEVDRAIVRADADRASPRRSRSPSSASLSMSRALGCSAAAGTSATTGTGMVTRTTTAMRSAAASKSAARATN